MPTEPRIGTETTAPQERAWRLSETVALRPEPFGALAYDFATRRLSFLTSPTLVDVVRRLEDHPTMVAAMAAAGVTEIDRGAHLAALLRLAAGGMIRVR